MCFQHEFSNPSGYLSRCFRAAYAAKRACAPRRVTRRDGGGVESAREVYRKPVNFHAIRLKCQTQNVKTFNNGSLGSRIDEERSEMR